AEDVVDVAAEPGVEGAGTEAARGLMAEPVVAGALVGVAEDLIGFRCLLELLLRVLVAGVLVRVELEGELAEGALQFLGRGGAGNPEDLIVIALLGHLLSSGRTGKRSTRLV